MEKNGYRLINSLLLSAVGLYGFGRFWGVDEPAGLHLFVAAFTVCILALWCQVRIKGRAIICMSAVATFLVTWFVLGADGAGNIIRDYQEYIKVVLLSFICFFLQLLLEKVFWMKLGVSVCLLLLLFWDLFTVRELSQPAVVTALTYIVITYVEWVQRGWKKERTNRKQQYVMWVMPFLAFYFVLMCMMPISEKPYDWQFAKDAYVKMREAFRVVSQNWFDTDREDFVVGNSGFSGSGGLLGGITQTEKEVMRIKGQKSLKTNVYLMGKVYDTFYGRKWEQTSTSDTDDRTLDALETLQAVRIYNEELEENYVHVTKLEMTYRFFHTAYLFSPLKTVGVTGVDSQYTTEGGNRLLPSKKGYGTNYTASFVQINVDHPLFYEFLEAVQREDAEVWRQVQNDYRAQSDRRYSLDDLSDYREEIREIYGKECQISDEMQTYLDEITADAGSEIERLKAIEKALSQMTYTLNPGELPKEIDTEEEFLDYFLLESKQGFCSYYATAFVLLARAEGVPARYVEGFCVPVEGDQETIVYSNMAHAWPEAYIEGVGWIPFEPTPGYEEIRYTPWEMKAGTDISGEGNGIGQGGNVYLQDEETEEVDVPEISEEPEEEPLEEQTSQGRQNLIQIVLITLLFVIVVCVVVILVDRKLKKYRYEKWTAKEKFLWEVRKNIRMLAFLGYERQENETLTELQKRAWAIMESDEETEAKVEGAGGELMFLELYEDVVYGEHPVEDEMLQTVIKEGEILLQLLRKWKRLAYYYCKVFVKF